MATELKGRRQRFADAISRAVDDWMASEPEWGRSDCILSVANIVRAVRGYDPAREVRGRYSTMRGALRVTKAHGGFAGEVERAAFLFNWRPVDPRKARIGDVGLARNEHGLRIGVIRGRGYWLARRQGPGVAFLKSSMIEKAWIVS